MRKDRRDLGQEIKQERGVPSRTAESNRLVQERLRGRQMNILKTKMNVIIIEMLPGIPEPETGIKTVFLSSVRLTHWFTKLCSRSTSLSLLSDFCIKRCNCWSRCCLLRATASLHLSRNNNKSSSWYESSCFCSLDRTETLPISTHVTVSQTSGSVPESRTGRTRMQTLRCCPWRSWKTPPAMQSRWITSTGTYSPESLSSCQITVQ